MVVPKMRIRTSCGVESSKRIPWILWQVNPSSVFSAFYSSACLCVSLLPPNGGSCGRGVDGR